jgi:hypothetical protein
MVPGVWNKIVTFAMRAPGPAPPPIPDAYQQQQQQEGGEKIKSKKMLRLEDEILADLRSAASRRGFSAYAYTS